MLIPSNLVEIGAILLSTEVSQTIDPLSVSLAIRRHRFGKWGRISPVEKSFNDASQYGGVFSIHESLNEREFWIISGSDGGFSRHSIMIRTYELPLFAKRWDDDDEHDCKPVSHLETNRWEAVKEQLYCRISNPLTLLMNLSVYEKARFGKCSDEQWRQNYANIETTGQSYLDANVSRFKLLTAMNEKQWYLRIWFTSQFRANMRDTNVGISEAARMFEDSWPCQDDLTPRVLPGNEIPQLRAGWGRGYYDYDYLPKPDVEVDQRRLRAAHRYL